MVMLISGAGIAGPAPAHQLAARGWRTTVVERYPQRRDEGQNVDVRGVARDVARGMRIEATLGMYFGYVTIPRHDADGPWWNWQHVPATSAILVLTALNRYELAMRPFVDAPPPVHSNVLPR